MKHLFLTLIILTAYTASSQISFRENVIMSEESTVEDPLKMIAADLNSDGVNDLIIISSVDSTLGWYKNLDGMGQFSNLINIEAVIAISSVAAGDIDGDGDVDLVVANSTATIGYWFENLDGQGNFGPRQNVFVSEVLHLELADIDGDGDNDIVYAGEDAGWLENEDGLGTFGFPQIVQTTGSNPSDIESIQATDLDGDGDLDLAFTIHNNSFRWSENLDGQGNFGNNTSVGTLEAVAIVAIDLDNDLDVDIVGVGEEVFWLENINGNATFAPRQTIETRNTTALSVADINSDGFLDIVTGTSEFNNSDVFWYEHLNGNGSFGAPQTTPIGANILSSVLAADLDGDTDIDLASTGLHNESVFWTMNLDGNGTFGNLPGNSILNTRIDGPRSVSTGDFDGDGDQDVVAAAEFSNSFFWYENVDGVGGMSLQRRISGTFSDASSVYPADIDGDSDIDIAFCVQATTAGTKLGWFENTDGNGTFATRQITTNLDGFSQIRVDDIDGDNDMDLLVVRSTLSRSVRFYRNLDGQGSFEFVQRFTLDGTGQIHLADVDGDSDIDFLQGRDWYENTDGNGTYVRQNIIPSQSGSVDSNTYIDAYADIDDDGIEDIVVFRLGELLWKKHLDGQGNFGPNQLIENTGVPIPSKKAVVTDVDNDNDLDVVISTADEDELFWYENLDGAGNFGVAQLIADDVQDLMELVVADMDNDGTQDLVTASFTDDKIAWFENLGTTQNEIRGTIRIDGDENGCDNSDAPIPMMKITASDGTNSYSGFTNQNGLFQLFVPEGDYTTSPDVESPHYTISPETLNSTFVGVGGVYQGNFCFEPTGNADDLRITLLPLSEARPGFRATYQLVYTNVGTADLTGSVSLSFNSSQVAFHLASEPVDQQTSDAIGFNYSNLQPFEIRTINLSFDVEPPPTVDSGDILLFDAIIQPISDDATPDDNEFQLEQVVVNSFDPNDITVLEGEEILEEEVGDYLHYVVRFQNLGTASAINVRIENELDTQLDWNTFELLSASHDQETTILNGSSVEFLFESIDLPPASMDEEGSKGFIAYRVKTLTSLGVGDFVSNYADIFFDFNAAITTNTVITTVVENLSIDDVEGFVFNLYPNPTSNVVQIDSDSPVVEIQLTNTRGQALLSIDDFNGITSFETNTLANGLYFIRLKNQQGISVTKKLLKK